MFQWDGGKWLHLLLITVVFWVSLEPPVGARRPTFTTSRHRMPQENDFIVELIWAATSKATCDRRYRCHLWPPTKFWIENAGAKWKFTKAAMTFMRLRVHLMIDNLLSVFLITSCVKIRWAQVTNDEEQPRLPPSHFPLTVQLSSAYIRRRYNACIIW